VSPKSYPQNIQVRVNPSPPSLASSLCLSLSLPGLFSLSLPPWPLLSLPGLFSLSLPPSLASSLPPSPSCRRRVQVAYCRQLWDDKASLLFQEFDQLEEQAHRQVPSLSLTSPRRHSLTTLFPRPSSSSSLSSCPNCNVSIRKDPSSRASSLPSNSSKSDRPQDPNTRLLCRSLPLPLLLLCRPPLTLLSSPKR
jgi:hypothetical protein